MILSACLALLLSAQAKFNPQVEKLFAWMDRLDCAQYLDRQFVKVSNEDDFRSDGAYGFLVSEDALQFSIMLPSLAVTRFPKKPWRKYDEPTTYAPIDFRMMVARTIARPDRDQFFSGDGPMPLPGRGFSLAYICERKAMASEANLLIVKAIKELRDSDDKDIFKAGKAQVYSDLLSVSVGAFENQSVTRSDLIKTFSKLASRFDGVMPDNDFALVAKKLEAMSKSDAAHIAKPFQYLTPEEQITEMVWQLHQDDGFWRDGEMPFNMLRDFGMPAVPQLLKACEDTSFVRALYHPFSGPMRPYSSGSIQTVQTIALSLLEGIAHQRFGYGDTEDQIRLAKEWYSDLQKKGEREMLIKGVKEGTIDSSNQARRLIKLYPEGALPVIIEGYEATTMSSWTRSHMLEVLKDLPTPESAAFLRKILSGTNEVQLRVAAAKSLAVSDSDGALDALRKTWTDNIGKKPDGFEFDEVIGGLLASRRPSVITFFQKDFRKNTSRTRSTVIGDLLSRWDYYNWKFKAKPDVKETALFEQMSEDFLASELEDIDEVGGGFGFNGFTLVSARLCDLALVNLHYFRPKVYPLPPSHEYRAMETNRVKMANVYRVRKGMSPLTLPTFVDSTPLKASVLEPLFKRIEKVDDQILAREVAAKGFAAYPALMARIDSTPPGPGLERLIEVARVISCQIREVNISGATTETEKAIAARIDRLRRQPVTSKLIDQMAREFGPNHAARSGASLKLRRDGETPGFTLSLSFDPDVVGEFINLTADETSVYNVGGGRGSYYGYMTEPEIARALHQCLSSAPTRRIQIFCSFAVAEKKKP